MSKAWYIVFILHTVYIVVTLIQEFSFMPGTPLYQIILHGVQALACTMVVLWYYVLYIKYVDVFAIFVRTTLTGDITQGIKSTGVGLILIGNIDWNVFFGMNRNHEILHYC